jgi:hypothetical protein
MFCGGRTHHTAGLIQQNGSRPGGSGINSEELPGHGFCYFLYPSCREVSVRRATLFPAGCRHDTEIQWRRDVTWQFLTEAMVLTGAGGVIGVLLGAGISLLINAFVPKLPSSIPLWSIALSVIVSMSVGLFFGMYPAVKAARLDPVEALRYE